MTPQEYLEQEFKDEPMLWKKEFQGSKLITVETCKRLMELYHNFEINRILKEMKK